MPKKTHQVSRFIQDIRSKRFRQESLQNNLQNTLAGHSLWVKFILAIFIALLCSIVVFISGYAGGVSGLNAVFGQKAPVEFRAMAFITVVVLITSIFKRLPLVLLAFFLSFCTVAIAFGILESSAPSRLPSSMFSFLVLTLIATAFGLGLSSVSFFGIRFALALVDVIFLRPYFLKLIGIVVIIFAAFFGALGAISGELDASNSEFRTLLATSLNARILVMLCGTLYGLSLAIGGWLANSLRGTPWNYPSLQRSWAIAVGSWLGTSFLNLDLSSVDFGGARLANTELRARKLYRTCFQGAIGLERARVDNQYLDLEYPKVQKLLTHGSSSDRDFKGFNLQGAYLQDADLRGFDFTNTNLTGADLKGADLRESILVRTQLAGVDFQGVDLRKNVLIDANLTEANFHDADLRCCILVRAQVARANFTDADLTGICIEDWSVSSSTRFTDVRCDYIYRKYQDGQPSDRYPADRDFEPGEFATLFTQPEDIVELVFKGEFDYAALSLALYKLQTEVSDLDLELKGIEQRGNLSVVKVKSGNHEINERLVRERISSVYQVSSHESTVETAIQDSLYRDYEEIKVRLATSEQLVNQLAGVTGNQAEALKELSRRSLGNSFFITGSTITNLAGSGQIEYTEAADQIRQVMTRSTDPKQVTSTLRGLITQFKQQNVATTASTQLELIQQIIVAEAEKDPGFKQFLLEQSQQVIGSMPKGAISTAVETAIAQLRTND